MVENLGCIARSGSKAFMEQFKAGGQQDPKVDSDFLCLICENLTCCLQEIIGQFGVGFYSAFMVADKIEVYSKSSVTPGPGYLWTSDGSGKYTMQEVEGLQPGTKIVLSLRKEDAEFSDETIVRDIVKKYSNFVGTDVVLNGDKINTLQPVWLMDPKEVDSTLHEEFYRL